MSDTQIYIRIASEGMAFVYTIQNSGKLIASGTVDVEETVAPGYYGGSEAMD